MWITFAYAIRISWEHREMAESVGIRVLNDSNFFKAAFGAELLWRVAGRGHVVASGQR